MLTYKNDPLLLNQETVNDLIKDKRENLIFLDDEKNIVNLYSAFVKKIDFIKKDKINQPFQKTVYVKISKKLTERINKKFSDKKKLKKELEQYICRRSNVNIDKWFRNKTFPFLLLRLISKNKKDFSEVINEIEYFTDFLSRSKFYHSSYLEDILNCRTVYLAGCSLGDGYIHKDGRTWVLVDGSSKKERMPFSQQFIFNLKKIVRTFVSSNELINYNTKYVLKVNNKLFCRFLNFFFGLPFGKKREVTLRTPLILKYNLDLEKYFWRGCFDTDGSVNWRGAVDFCSIDQNILNECQLYLKKQNILSKIRLPVLVINMSDLKKFSSIGFAHPRKQKEFIEILKRGPKFNSVKIKENQKEKIDKNLLLIHDLIRIDKNYRVRVHSLLLKEKKIDIEQVGQIINDLFGYNFRKASNNLFYFKSKKVHDYLHSLFIYEPAWKPITDEEELKTLENFNDVWLK